MTTRWLTIGLLGIAAVALGAVLAIAFAIPAIEDAERAGHEAQASAAPSQAASAFAPMKEEVPANADCSACHLTNGQLALRDIPAMAHPADGWRDCTACHANGSLVKTAPGHDGIHKDQCLGCHKPLAPGASGLPRPHHVVTGATCISCHGTEAPLPTDMAGRNNCWICHPGKENLGLFDSTVPAPTATP
jgi:hypothetical protein